MQIIKKGQIPEDRTYTCTCSHCKTEFQFEEREGKVQQHWQGDYVYIQCPLCSRYVYVSRE